jgi:GGDEF domain-containing protein
MERALEHVESLAVLYLDLDRFKSVNDTLESAASANDTVARLGGDEFALVQIGARPTDASELAGRIIERASRRCSDGITPSAARFHRPNSSRTPRRPA